MQPVRRWCGMALAVSALAQSASAQAWSYPAFQTPRIVEREFNIGVADGGIAGVSALFQWREQTGTRTQLSLERFEPSSKGWSPFTSSPKCER